MPQLPAQVLTEFRVRVLHYRNRGKEWRDAVNRYLPEHEKWLESFFVNLEYVEKNGRPRKYFETEHLDQLERAFGDNPNWPEWKAKFLEAIAYQNSLDLPLLKNITKSETGEETEAIDEVVETPIIEAGKSQSEKSEAPMTFQTDIEEQDDLPGRERRKLLPLAALGLIVVLGGSCLAGVWLTRALTPKPTPQAAVIPTATTEAKTKEPAPIFTAEPAAKITPTLTNTAVPTSTATKTPTVTPTPFPLPFEDDFSSGLTDSWRTLSGRWGWADGHLEARESPGWAVMLTGDQDWTDYAVEVDIGANYRWTETRIVLRAVGENYIAFNLSDDPLYAYTLVKVDNSKTIEIARGRGQLDVELGGHSYRAEVVGDFYRLYQDGYLAFETQDDSFTQGAVGLGISGHLEDAWFDNFRVTAR